MKVLDLFSGIGGFSLGLERAGMETVAFCEIEPFCRKVLRKHWPDVPIYEDVRKLNGDTITADVVCGGYPCQPFSTAGKRQGAEDDRHLWPEMRRIIASVRPRWVIAENVAGHISMGLDQVLADLEAEDYAWWAFVIPACAVDAYHRRDRVWIVANARNDVHAGELDARRYSAAAGRGEGRDKFQGQTPHRQRFRDELGASGATSAYTNSERGRSRNPQWENAAPIGQSSRHSRNDSRGVGLWHPEPGVGRVANGVPRRVDRIRALGNAVVPQVVQVIGEAIMAEAK